MLGRLIWLVQYSRVLAWMKCWTDLFFEPTAARDGCKMHNGYKEMHSKHKEAQSKEMEEH